jgi:hypothetical protein
MLGPVVNACVGTSKNPGWFFEVPFEELNG